MGDVTTTYYERVKVEVEQLRAENKKLREERDAWQRRHEKQLRAEADLKARLKACREAEAENRKLGRVGIGARRITDLRRKNWRKS